MRNNNTTHRSSSMLLPVVEADGGSAKSATAHCWRDDAKEPRIGPRVKNTQGQR